MVVIDLPTSSARLGTVATRAAIALRGQHCIALFDGDAVSRVQFALEDLALTFR